MASRIRVLSNLLGFLHPNNAPASVAGKQLSSAAPHITKADDWWGKCNRIQILDGEMSYYDSDPGQTKSRDAVVFLHGNPTSSFLWRNVIPHVEGSQRCLAPDLIGMGRSSKLPITYKYKDHYRYLSAWFDAVNLPPKVSIVCHDWGSGLGFHWCHMHPDRVKSIIHMESIVATVPDWSVFPEIARKMFQSLRSDAGVDMVLENNLFVELLLPRSIIRELSDDEMEAYREPFRNPGEDRRPTLTWPREIPIETDGPQDVVAIVNAYHDWLSQSANIPKLFIDADPGFFSPTIRIACRNWPNHKMVQAKGYHFLQEDSADEIGRAIHQFLSEL
ncbi:renilla-luciferin 2-monooxygenase-like [Acanthaster planci]|uniref:Renilla-luciferin 2-monooxygenase-like n=1 Tax=Acanthaster planci TaxID=133434 RepID=A0A8B7YEM8_ACAPL|nr:renilla-luciferin 2-monooxygenase-like [Acanthaster planci]